MNGEREKERHLIMIAFFADGERKGETIAGRGKRARRKRGVSAGGIFHAIEIENKFARLVEAVSWKTGVEKAAGGIRRPGAGGVAQDEK